MRLFDKVDFIYYKGTPVMLILLLLIIVFKMLIGHPNVCDFLWSDGIQLETLAPFNYCYISTQNFLVRFSRPGYSSERDYGLPFWLYGLVMHGMCALIFYRMTIFLIKSGRPMYSYNLLAESLRSPVRARRICQMMVKTYGIATIIFHLTILSTILNPEMIDSFNGAVKKPFDGPLFSQNSTPRPMYCADNKIHPVRPMIIDYPRCFISFLTVEHVMFAYFMWLMVFLAYDITVIWFNLVKLIHHHVAQVGQ